MNLCGEKVILRAVEPRDLELLQRWKNDPEVEFFQGESWSPPVGKKAQELWFRSHGWDSRTMRWMIELRGRRPRTVGYCGFWSVDWKNRKAQTGLVIGNGSDRGRGVGVDVLRTLADYGFRELGLNKLYACIAAYNKRSLGLFVRKCGWRQEGLFHQSFFRQGRFHDTVQVSILAREVARRNRE